MKSSRVLSVGEAAAAREAAPVPVMAVDRFERFFRVVASLDVDKDDLRRYNEFVIHKLADLLIRGEAIAKANQRDVIQPQDLPVTKGLQERILEFKKTDEREAIHLRPILDRLAEWRPIELTLDVETERQLPDIAGGLSVALARAFKVIDPGVKNPQSEQWERAFRIFDLLL
jgi:hypothetical protein